MNEDEWLRTPEPKPGRDRERFAFTGHAQKLDAHVLCEETKQCCRRIVRDTDDVRDALSRELIDECPG